jgi:hypothetical protein
LIQHKPHRKRHVQQFYCWIFIAVATWLPSRHLAMIEGYTYRHRLMQGIYEVHLWDGLRCHDMYTKLKYAVEMGSGAMICIPSWSTPLRWAQVPWYVYQVEVRSSGAMICIPSWSTPLRWAQVPWYV